MKKLRIAMIGQRGVPATYGGIERHVEELGSRLAERGHDVVVFGRTNYADEAGSRPDTYRGMRLVWQRPVATKHFEALSASAQAAFRTVGQGFDIVHFHAVGPGLLSPVPRVLTKAKVVQTIHGFDAERAKWGGVATAMLRTGTWMSAHVPDATIVVARNLGETLVERYGAKSTVYITNGTAPAVRRPAGEISERWGLEPGRYILWVGRLVPEKATDLLVRAYGKVPGDVPLVIVGGSSFSDEYAAQLASAARDDARVVLTGFTYGTTLQELYTNAGLFVLPSLLEGLPLTVLEGASYGLPIIASDIPAHVEVLGEHGPGHRLVPAGDDVALADEMALVLADLGAERQGAEWLRDRVAREYSWDAAADRTEELYLSLVR
jgi:glycosyltransferase involved in cell wall biosynthesis